MDNKHTKDTASTEALIAGIAALSVTVLWIAYSPFHPLVILTLYLVALFCLSSSALWYLSKGQSLRGWFAKHPIRFFIAGFIEVFLIVALLDIYYLYGLFDFGKWENILVEAHGLVFDLFIFGIVLTAYEAIRSKQDKIERYKEELDDYRGWTENEAAYRVAGIIRRLVVEGVEDINFDRLHLGQCPKEIVEEAVKAKAHIISLQGAFLEEANLQGAFLKEANLQEAFLEEANLQEAFLEEANLQEAHLLGANLQKANLFKASLQGAILMRADLQEANLWQANLQKAYLLGANLQEAYLLEANLQGAYLGGANLQGAFLMKASLQGAFLAGTSLQGAKVDRVDWIEKLKEWDVIGAEVKEAKYYVDETPGKYLFGNYFLIKEKPVGEKKDTVPMACTAKTKNGELCKRRPKKGFDQCYQHLNQDEQ